MPFLFKAAFKAAVAISQANCKSEDSRDDVRHDKQIAHNNHISFWAMCLCGCIISSIYVWPGGRKVDYLSFSSQNTKNAVRWTEKLIKPHLGSGLIMTQLWCLYGLHEFSFLSERGCSGSYKISDNLTTTNSSQYPQGFFFFWCSNMKHLGHFNVSHHSTLF